MVICTGDTVEYDRKRDLFFKSEGYDVLRFTNHDITCNLNGVLATIHHALGLAIGADEPPTPNPSPQGGGERTR